VYPDRVLAQVEHCFQGLGGGAAPRAEAPDEQREPRFSFVRHSASSQTDLRVSFRAPGETDADEPATELLLRILDDGMSTRLYHQICDARGLCYDVSAGYEAYADSGLVDLAAESAHERATQVLDELFKVVEELRDQGPSGEELARAKQRYGWQLTEMLDDPGEAADFYALGQLTGVARTPAERLEQLTNVSREHVRAAAQRIFRRPNLSVVAVGLLPRRAQEALARRTHDFG
jgi:predicted Zn-dependent peptidase